MSTATVKITAAAVIINKVCDRTGYTRAYVASVMRSNAKTLRATKSETGRWIIFSSRGERPERALERLVRTGAGPRYRHGEKGPNRRQPS